MGEVKDIPKNWKVKKLGEVCDVLDNLRKPINSTERQQRIAGKSQSELFPYYGATGQVGWIDSFITDGEYILIGEDGAPFLDIYKDKAYKVKGKTWVNNHAHILKGKTEIILDDFALYYLNSIKYREFVNGTTRLKLTKSNLVDIPFVIPPLPEQQAIVAKIEELLSDLENGKQQLQTAQQQLKVYRQSLMKWAFEGKLTNNNVKEGELPKGWKWVSINEIGKVKGGKRLPPKHQYSEEETEYVYIMAGNLKEGTVKNKPKYIKEETYKALLNYKVTGGEVYITIVGACIGDAGIVPENIGKSILTENAAKIVELKDVHNKYLSRWINSLNCQLQIKRKILSATLGKLALTRIGTLEIPLPSIKEQQHIIDELESKLTVCDKIEETISHSLQQAETLRQSILKKAFEGKLVTQNPNDEPASKLLERIKAESPKNEVEKKKSRRDVIIIGGGEE